jgi:hypothetical protein
MPSGLPEQIGDNEDIARFLTQSSHFTSASAKPSAFLPTPREQETSVSRHGKDPADRLKALGGLAAGGRSLYGAALLKALDIRKTSLSLLSDEPPDFHAVIHNWPIDNDPALQKAKQKEIALQLVSSSELFLFTLEGT